MKSKGVMTMENKLEKSIKIVLWIILLKPTTS